eukprot:3466556-Pleurochrysis_carterae.AAC.1
MDNVVDRWTLGRGEDETRLPMVRRAWQADHGALEMLAQLAPRVLDRVTAFIYNGLLKPFQIMEVQL